jgi:phosphoribosylaminoimidazolecarboxamide formyltransferase/IMP cyclohydrolase
VKALISVSNKDGIIPFCLKLRDLNIEIISTGGTGKLLSENGISYTPIEEVTKMPEAFGGRMKTISFQIGSALLYKRNSVRDIEEAQLLGISAIDLVICNLYPFLEAQKKQVSENELIEMIDIGGPTMIRAAAKNFESVTCITDASDYDSVLNELLLTGKTTIETRKTLALKAFQLTAQYDQMVQLELSKRWFQTTKPTLSSEEKKLRYGENPHQAASLCILPLLNAKHTLATAPILQGKEISYNNYLDSDQAYKCVSELAHVLPKKKSVVIVKHGIPCGVALSENLLTALEKAWACDDISAFGGVISLSDKVDIDCANFFKDKFVEVIIAPDFSADALQIFAKKKNIRLLKLPLKNMNNSNETMIRSINGGVLLQQEDEKTVIDINFEIKTKNNFSQIKNYEELKFFGQTVVKYLKSNCLVLVKAEANNLVIQASGVGQPNRLECLTKLLAPKIENQNLNETILFSDAFFPFRDSIDAAFLLGVKYIVQPGGSIKDQEVIDACDEHGIAMALTASRHFRH